MIEGKIWGQTVEIEANGFMSLHRAKVDAGHRCSRHHHVNKWNGFLVISGRLRVRVWQPSGIEDETVLGPGEFTTVAPGVQHRFESLADTDLVEYYWPAEVAVDIVRQDEGGKLSASPSGGDRQLVGVPK